jgi:hypothetical protein
MNLNDDTVKRFNEIIDTTNASVGQPKFAELYQAFRRTLVPQLSNGSITEELYSEKLKVVILLFIIISSEKHDDDSAWDKWVYDDGKLYKELPSVCQAFTAYDGEYDEGYTSSGQPSETYNNIMKPCVTHDIYELLEYNDRVLMPDDGISRKIIRTDEPEVF